MSKKHRDWEENKVVIEKTCSSHRKKINYTLAKPILFFDLFNLIVFDGYFQDNTIYYSQIVQPFFPLADPFVKWAKKGDRIIVTDDKITIYNKEKKLFTYKKKNNRDGFVLDFK